MSMIQGLLAEFENEAKTTRRVLERVPNDKLTWRPHPKLMTDCHRLRMRSPGELVVGHALEHAARRFGFVLEFGEQSLDHRHGSESSRKALILLQAWARRLHRT